jgi:predicted site-specific integrase-resolvase
MYVVFHISKWYYGVGGDIMIYKPGEFAKLIGVAVITLQKWDRQGKLRAYRTLGGRRYYTEEHLKKIEATRGDV